MSNHNSWHERAKDNKSESDQRILDAIGSQRELERRLFDLSRQLGSLSIKFAKERPEPELDMRFVHAIEGNDYGGRADLLGIRYDTQTNASKFLHRRKWEPVWSIQAHEDFRDSAKPADITIGRLITATGLIADTTHLHPTVDLNTITMPAEAAKLQLVTGDNVDLVTENIEATKNYYNL